MITKKRPLAIFTPILGRWSHAFVKSHINGILPELTAVVAIGAFEPSGPCWGVDAPTLYVPPKLKLECQSVAIGKTMFDEIPAAARERFASEDHVRRIRGFLIEHGVEAVLAQWLHDTIPLADVAKDLGIRYYCQAHGTDITAGLTDSDVRSAYQGYNDSDGVVAPSKFGRRQLLELGLEADVTHVIRHAVNIPTAPEVRPRNPIRCLAVGRMDPMKGPLILIDAFRRALELFPDLHLDYVGDGLMRPAVEELINSFELQGHISLHGCVDHGRVHRLMKRSHVFIHPSLVENDSRYDTCPVAVAEAMAHGMAVVATRHGGIPEQVTDGESGFLVPEGDSRALADRIMKFAGDPALRKRLGEAAWLRAREMFSPEIVRRNWLELMQLEDAWPG